MPVGEKDFNQTSSFKGGAAFEYIDLSESDFISAAGSAYTPPETGVVRRINVSRTLQLLKNSPSLVTTTQTSLAYLRVPSGLIATNDALDGRIFYIKNAGTSDLTIQNHLGTNIAIIKENIPIILFHKEDNAWVIFFTSDIPISDSAAPPFTLGKSGKVVKNAWLLNDTVPSNLAGRVIPVNGDLAEIFLSCQNNTTATVSLYKRSGASFVFLDSITLTATRSGTKTSTGVVIVRGDEIAARVDDGSLQNPVLGFAIKGRFV